MAKSRIPLVLTFIFLIISAQGFVAAQDRLFQMELWKRAGQGRLAEVLGPSAVQRDRYARLLRYRGDMKTEYASYAPDAYAILKAFTDGINAYIKSSASKLPIEFKLAGFAPEPWKPEDCLSRMAAFSMTGNAFAELDNTATLNALGPEKFRRLSNPSPMVDPDPVAATLRGVIQVHDLRAARSARRDVRCGGAAVVIDADRRTPRSAVVVAVGHQTV